MVKVLATSGNYNLFSFQGPSLLKAESPERRKKERERKTNNVYCLFIVHARLAPYR